MTNLMCVCVGDLSALKKSAIVLKENAKYRVKIYFYVQREIVSGLKYVQKILRKGIQGTVDLKF